MILFLYFVWEAVCEHITILIVAICLSFVFSSSPPSLPIPTKPMILEYPRIDNLALPEHSLSPLYSRTRRIKSAPPNL